MALFLKRHSPCITHLRRDSSWPLFRNLSFVLVLGLVGLEAPRVSTAGRTQHSGHSFSPCDPPQRRPLIFPRSHQKSRLEGITAWSPRHKQIKGRLPVLVCARPLTNRPFDLPSYPREVPSGGHHVRSPSSRLQNRPFRAHVPLPRIPVRSIVAQLRVLVSSRSSV